MTEAAAVTETPAPPDLTPLQQVSGEAMVAWALANMSKRCGLCHGTRLVKFLRGKPARRIGMELHGETVGQDVCGCAIRAFFKAHAGKVGVGGDGKVYWTRENQGG